MKHIVTLIIAIGIVVGFACSPDDGAWDPAPRTAEVEYNVAVEWPCWPNCPDPNGECFGECINGGYCDDPACCVDPDNCLCYSPDSPISQALCGEPCDDCFGECIGGSYCDNPDCCIDPDNCVCYVPEHAISQILCGPKPGKWELPAGAEPVVQPEPVVLPTDEPCDMCFGECIGGGYCDTDPACCINPDACLCYAPWHPISQILCGGDCFGECIGGGYCDSPDCCIENGNCMCYAPSHPISQFMCR